MQLIEQYINNQKPLKLLLIKLKFIILMANHVINDLFAA